MRLLLTLLLLTTATTGFTQEISYTLSGTVFGTGQDSIYLAQFYGTHYTNFQGVKLKKNGNFTMKGTLPNPDYYVLKVGDEHINLIIRDSADIKVYADGTNINKYVNFIGSDESAAMFEYLTIADAFQKKSDSAMLVIQNDPTQRNQINQMMRQEYYKFKGQQQSFISRNTNSAALFPVVGSIDVKNDFASYEAIVKQLIQGFGESPSVKNLQQQYEQIKAERFANDPLAPGKVAPDFEEMMPDSTMMKLSDLQGKVVLIDFWASWCGPCRRENPNVVKLYEQYKDDGFTVLSVSLDKMRPNWLAAIEKDNLSWPYHVSDLKHWSSKVAKLYGVTGIPFTVLVDQDGKIIATKLRGEQLHNELKRIFGH